MVSWQDLTALTQLKTGWDNFWGTDNSINGNSGDGTSDWRPAEDHDKDGVPNGIDPDYDPDRDGGSINAGDRNQNDILDSDEKSSNREPQTKIHDVDQDKDINWSDFAREARVVEPGEGWYQTFQDMGIPQITGRCA